MAESKEELKSLLVKVKEESEKGGLKLNIKKKKTKMMASGPIVSWPIDGAKVETVTGFTFFHKGDVICISEVIDISPSNLDSSLHFFLPSISHEVMGADAMIFVFLMLSFKPAFFTFLFHFHQEAL